jgi:hypothetical protein
LTLSVSMQIFFRYFDEGSGLSVNPAVLNTLES